MSPWLRRLTAVAAVVAPVLASLAAAQPAFAAPITCSVNALVAAINTANGTAGGATVTLPSGCVYRLHTADNATDGGTGLPVITGNVTVTGSGSTIRRAATAGTPAFRIFDVATGGQLTLNSVTVAGGLANDGVNGGGGIFSHGTLTITRSTFTHNSSPAQTGTSGGAINSSGVLTVQNSTFYANTGQEGGGIFSQQAATITNSTFTNNTATVFGGGAVVSAAGATTVADDTFVGNSGPGGGALDNDATLNVSDSTFFNNTAGNNGGGAIVNFGTANVTQATLSGNTAPFGSDVLNFTGFSLTMSMSIVTGGLNGANCGGESPITDGGYNIDSGSSCAFSSASHSMSNTQPQLDPLAFNGGPTRTMALPAGSPAVDAIPSGTPGCSGTDQRGRARPQGAGCDIGAYERVVTTGDHKPPTVPTGLTVTSTTANSVALKWTKSTDNVGVTGYTIYRNGTMVGSTGGTKATTFTDITAAPSTTYQYQVDAFDGSGNHSAESAAVQVTTPAPSGITAGQGGAVSTSNQVTSTTITLPGPVHAGDLLVGWFGQFASAGQVSVSDNVNGVWTRSASTTFSSGNGDIALYYLQNSAAAPFGLTITITASSPTFLQGVATEYGGIATANALDQVAVGQGTGTTADSGPTGSVGAGELLFSGLMTGAAPGTVSANGGLTIRNQTPSSSVDDADASTTIAGPQDVNWTLQNSADWYEVAAAFHAAP